MAPYLFSISRLFTAASSSKRKGKLIDEHSPVGCQRRTNEHPPAISYSRLLKGTTAAKHKRGRQIANAILFLSVVNQGDIQHTAGRHSSSTIFEQCRLFNRVVALHIP